MTLRDFIGHSDRIGVSRVRVGFAGVGQLVPMALEELLRGCVVIVCWQLTNRLTETPMASPEPYRRGTSGKDWSGAR